MSVVTNLIIVTGNMEKQKSVIANLSGFETNGGPFIIVSVDDEALPMGWYGGGKMLEVEIFIGAYNHLDLNALLEYMREKIVWVDPEMVQLFVKEDDDFKFRIIDLFLSP